MRPVDHGHRALVGFALGFLVFYSLAVYAHRDDAPTGQPSPALVVQTSAPTVPPARPAPTTASRSRTLQEGSGSPTRGAVRREPPRATGSPRPHLRRGWVRVNATAYCATGNRMANGHWPHPGAAAANRWPLGTRLLIREMEVAVLRRDVVLDLLAYDPYMARDAGGRYILLDALTALACAEAALAQCDRPTP
jgi:hypothetical protein